jgi:hypothetical protein
MDISKLDVNVYYETKSRIHIKITDPASDRFQVPDVVKTQLPTHRASSVCFENHFICILSLNSNVD